MPVAHPNTLPAPAAVTLLDAATELALAGAAVSAAAPALARRAFRTAGQLLTAATTPGHHGAAVRRATADTGALVRGLAASSQVCPTGAVRHASRALRLLQVG